MSAPLRVVHLITKLELGGAQLNTLYTFEHLDPGKFCCWLVSGPGGLLRPVAREAEWITARHLERAIRPLGDLLAFFELRRILKKLRPQVVHTHSAKAGFLGRLAARSLGVPVIIHSVHGFSFSPYQPLLQRLFYRLAERLSAPLTTHFIFVAQADLDLARSLRLVRENGTLIRSGFPLARFLGRKEDPASGRQRYGIPPGAVVCGVVAPFKPQKGLLHLAAIARQVVEKDRRILFLLAGDGPLRLRLEAELQAQGIAAHFRLPGFIRDVERVMDLFDIGVTTSLWEGLPQSLVQMRLKKIPIVASDIPGNREVVREGENGFLVDVSDHIGFAGRILQLASDPGLRRKLGQFDAEDFSEWDAGSMVKRQENLYLRLWGA